MLQRIRRILELEDLRRDLEFQVTLKNDEVDQLVVQTILAFASIVDKRDIYTRDHSKNVAKYARALASHLDLDEQAQRHIYFAGLLHDIGKVGVPENIVAKASPLTEREFKLMQRHTEIGSAILANITNMPSLAQAALSHHEFYNGEGYPRHLIGENIPLVGRIVAIADAVDNMLSPNAYRKNMAIPAVVAELKNKEGIQFDPKLVDYMCNILINEFETLDEFILEHENITLLHGILEEYVKVLRIDSLTNLYTYQYMEELVNNYITAQPDSHGLLLVLNICGYSKLIEEVGEDTARFHLRRIADLLMEYVKKSGFVGYLNKDEFAVYFKDAAEDKEKQVKDLLAYVSEHIEERFKNHSLTCGVSEYPIAGTQYTGLYINADKALHQLKLERKVDYLFYR